MLGVGFHSEPCASGSVPALLLPSFRSRVSFGMFFLSIPAMCFAFLCNLGPLQCHCTSALVKSSGGFGRSATPPAPGMLERAAFSSTPSPGRVSVKLPRPCCWRGQPRLHSFARRGGQSACSPACWVAFRRLPPPSLPNQSSVSAVPSLGSARPGGRVTSAALCSRKQLERGEGPPFRFLRV